MKVATSETMRNIDRISWEEYKISGVVLMENAAHAVLETCLLELRGVKKPRVIIFAGRGNNGGDGLALARLFDNKGIETEVIFLGKSIKKNTDAYVNYEIAKKIGININSDFANINLRLEKFDLIIDAIFGTGFKGEIKDPEAKIIKEINNADKRVVSIDIPSGINADTAKCACEVVDADVTVVLGLPKLGNILYPAADYNGEVRTYPISIPKKLIDEIKTDINILTIEDAKALMPKRAKRSNKGTFGKVCVLAGSETMLGAAVLASKAAYKTGAGLVYTCTVSSRIGEIQTMIPETVALPLKHRNGYLYGESIEDAKNNIENANAVVIGPGLGLNNDIKDFVRETINIAKATLIIDADALNALSENMGMLEGISKVPILTPHPKEMERLSKISVKDILDNPIDTAIGFSKRYNVITVLKDARTVIASPDGNVYINATGNSSMAKGGSGDVLTGIIAGLVAQGLDSYMSSVLGVYIHGLAGECSSRELSEYGVFASDIAENISAAINLLV